MSSNTRKARETRSIPLAGALVLGVSMLATGCLGLGKDGDATSANLAVSSGSATGLAAFQTGFWAFAKTNCSSCHGATQQPLFAVSDVNQAYSYARSSQWVDFKDPANALFVLRAGDSHCGQSNCVGKSSTVQPLIESWATAELTGPTSPGGGPPTPPAGIKYFSQGVAVPASVSSGATTGATYVVMRWQMNALSPAQPLLGNSIFEIEIQSLNANTYHIRNPKIVGTTGAVLVKGIHVLIRKAADPAPGAEDPLGDGWKADAVSVQPKALPVPLPTGPIPNSQIIDANAQGENILSGSDVITIGFEDLTAGTVVPPLGPTFASIFGNIIQPKCLGCHGATAAQTGNGVSLATYAAVSGSVVPNNPNTSLFYTAVVSGNPLMPYMATPLSAAEKTAINGWITAGALNN